MSDDVAELENQQRKMMRDLGPVGVSRRGTTITHRLDLAMYVATVRWGRRKYGVGNIFNEKEFVKDCERHHPWFKTQRGEGAPIAVLAPGDAGMVSRFGRVTERVVYGKDGERKVVIHGR